MRRFVQFIFLFLGAGNILCQVLANDLQISVTLPSFPIAINQYILNNEYRCYPFLSYNGITYFPMTYDDCLYLDLNATWSKENGLEVTKADQVNIFSYTETLQEESNANSYTATVADFPIAINGKKIDNGSELYPLFSFRNVAYFPMTWRFTVTEFAWENSFDSKLGLSMNSMWKIVSFTVTDSQFYALDNKGNLWTWGDEECYWAADGSEKGKSEPVLLLDKVKIISCYNDVCSAIKNDNSLWIWHKQGSSEDLPPNGDVALQAGIFCAPYQVAEDVKELISWFPFMYVKRDGSLWGMGQNYQGQLGVGQIERIHTTVCLFTDVKEVCNRASATTLVLQNDGSLWGMGSNEYGQLGLDQTEYQREPVRLFNNVKTMFQNDGATMTYVIFNDDSLWVAGSPIGHEGTATTSFNKLLDDVATCFSHMGRTYALKYDGSFCTLNTELHENMIITHTQQLLTDVKDISQVQSCDYILQSDGSLWALGRLDQGYPNGYNAGMGVMSAPYWGERRKAGGRQMGWLEEPTRVAENVKAIYSAEGTFASKIHLSFIVSEDNDLFVLAIGHEDELRKLCENVVDVSFSRHYGLVQMRDGTLLYRRTPMHLRQELVISLFKDSFYAEEFQKVPW